MEKKIEVGDKVYLNSGGPELEVLCVSIDGIDGTELARVVWRTEDIFPTACLKRNP